MRPRRARPPGLGRSRERAERPAGRREPGYGPGRGCGDRPGRGCGDRPGWGRGDRPGRGRGDGPGRRGGWRRDRPGGPRPAGRRPAGRRPGRGRRASAAPGSALAFCPVRRTPAVRAALARAVPGSGRAQIEPLGVTGDAAPLRLGLDAGLLGRGRDRPGHGARCGKSWARSPTRAATRRMGPRRASGRSGPDLLAQQPRPLHHVRVERGDRALAATGRGPQSIAGPGGVPWPSPWHAPAVSGKYAAWAQGATGRAARSRSGWPTCRPGQVTTDAAQATRSRRLFDGGLLSGRSRTHRAPRPRCGPTAWPRAAWWRCPPR